MTYDGIHHYTYDAEGNITQVDGGATATYAYNALNQRVHVATASGTVEFVFDLNGKRRSFWNGGRDATELRSQYYWGSQPIAYSDGALHFQHLDWTGTMRMQSGATGAEETQYSSYPWGDGFTDSGAGVYGGGSSEDDAYHFAALDHDYESGTDHAQFRNYSSAQGRWLAPDPYDGSYDATNPQSFNRYAYVLNNPLSFIDPSGLLDCKYPPCEPQPAPPGCNGDCPPSQPPPPQPIDPPPSNPGCGDDWSCGGGGGGGGGGGTGTPPKKPVNKNCPAVPQTPPGVNLSNNMNAAANAAFLPDPFGLLWFNNRVQYGGAWDYKQYGPQYEAFGNFNYGATGASMNLP